MSLRDFRNVRFFHASGAWPDSEAALSAALEPAAFKPCAAYAERSMGFEAPVEGAGDALCRSIAGADLLRLRLQTRVLPTAVVKESLVERVDAFKQRMQRDPNRSEKRELKEDVYGQLLPQALLKSDRISACFLRQESVLVVGSVTDKVVEEFIETLRRGLAGIQFAPLASRRAPVELMTKIFMVILFFMLAGASAHLDAMLALGGLVGLYMVARCIGSYIGCYSGTRLAGASRPYQVYLGLTLFPQAGVAIGMALLAAQRFPDIGAIVLPTILASTVLFELLAPPLSRWALLRANGQVNHGLKS